MRAIKTVASAVLLAGLGVSEAHAMLPAFVSDLYNNGTARISDVTNAYYAILTYVIFIVIVGVIFALIARALKRRG